MGLLYKLIQLLLFTGLKLPFQKSSGIFSVLTFQGLLWLECIPLKSGVKALWLLEMIHSFNCSPPDVNPFMKRGEGKRQKLFWRTLHSCSGNLLLGPSQNALKEIHHGSEVICSWHYLCYYYILLFATRLLFQLKETALSLRCCVLFEMIWVIKLPQSCGSRDKSLWLLAAVYLRWRIGHGGQVIAF